MIFFVRLVTKLDIKYLKKKQCECVNILHRKSENDSVVQYDINWLTQFQST